jgi:hypothetical protein
MPKIAGSLLHSHEGKLLLVVVALAVFLSVATRSFLTAENMLIS